MDRTIAPGRRMADRILAGHAWWGACSNSTEQVLAALTKAKDATILAIRSGIAIDATSASDYYNMETDQENWEMSDFPNLAPPWPTALFEFEAPEYINSIVNGRQEWGSSEEKCFPLRSMVMVQSIDLGEENKARWSSTCTLSWQFRGNPNVLMNLASVTYLVTPEGKMLNSQNNNSCLFTFNKLFPPFSDDKYQSQLIDSVTPFFHCVWLAMSFIHCKNVTLVPGPGCLKIKQGNKLKRKPIIRYHVLEIGAIKKILSEEGDVAKTGIKRALHICRGHFAHYGDSFGTKKLFGKYEGTFWVPTHIKGNKKEGLVIKDYSIAEKAVGAVKTSPC